MTTTEVLVVKDAVRARDGQRCTECGMTADEHRARYSRTLDVHRLVPGSAYSLEGCVTLCRICHGPQPKSPRGSSPLTSVKLPADLVTMARVVAAYEGIRFSQYLGRIVAEAGPRILADLTAFEGRSPPDLAAPPPPA